MQLASERPHVRAHCRDGSVWMLAMAERPSLESHLVQGKSFWYGTDAWGGQCVIKLADLVGLSVWDQSKIDAMAADADEERARAVLRGD